MFVCSAERFEQLCMHAEGLVDSSNRKERDGDLPQALLHCNRAIGGCLGTNTGRRFIQTNTNCKLLALNEY